LVYACAPTTLAPVHFDSAAIARSRVMRSPPWRTGIVEHVPAEGMPGGMDASAEEPPLPLAEEALPDEAPPLPLADEGALPDDVPLHDEEPLAPEEPPPDDDVAPEDELFPDDVPRPSEPASLDCPPPSEEVLHAALTTIPKLAAKGRCLRVFIVRPIAQES
jgi:hypothetical protein